MPRTGRQPTRRFGLELEFLNPEDRPELSSRYAIAQLITATLAARGFDRDVAYVDDDDDDEGQDGSGWVVKTDGSCEWEVCTPACTWADWSEVRAVMQALYRAGARTRRNCGLHVHHEMAEGRLEHLRKLWYLWYLFEPALFSMLAPSRRTNQYCEQLRTWPESPETAEFRRDRDLFYSPELAAASDVLRMPGETFHALVRDFGRYQSLNLLNWWEHGRIEVRAHHGTLAVQDVRFWVRLTQRMVTLATRVSRRDLLRISPDLGVSEQVCTLGRLLHRVSPEQSRYWNRQMRAAITRRNPAQLAVVA